MTWPGHTLRFMATAAQRAAYNRKYYERGGAALIRKHNAAAKRRNRKLVMAFKESTPCVDCGRRYPHYVMDFDHVQGTKAATSRRWPASQSERHRYVPKS